MFKLWDSNKKIEKVFETEDLAYLFIDNYLKEIKFKSYYFRQSLLENGTIWIDYGSHSHFFYIQNLTANL